MVLERDDGSNKYKLRFRAEEEREAYLTLVQRRIAKFAAEQRATAMDVGGGVGLASTEAEAWRRQRVAWGDPVPLETSMGLECECLAFKLHVFDAER